MWSPSEFYIFFLAFKGSLNNIKEMFLFTDPSGVTLRAVSILLLALAVMLTTLTVSQNAI